jgi:signal transduction histidine kinase
MMALINLTTEFAPPEKASIEEILADNRQFISISFLQEFANTIPDIYFILNEQRQVVFTNNALHSRLSINDIDQILGRRPGEILRCVHSTRNSGGCGTSEFCRSCGAVNAILTSLQGKSDVQDCQIVQEPDGNALDLRVWTYFMMHNGKKYSVFLVKDISHEKRRLALERIFFHDILNTAGGLNGLLQLVKMDSTEIEELKDVLAEQSDRLIEEIHSQKDLVAAENYELSYNPSTVNSSDFIESIKSLYKAHNAAIGKRIVIGEDMENFDFISDRTILQRIIGNMVKNALEASPDSGRVTISCRQKENEIEFSVHNQSFIPRDIQLQIFRRSFSTKGSGRGLGTYSMKLLTERYLKGTVYFESSEANGTTFYCNFMIT